MKRRFVREVKWAVALALAVLVFVWTFSFLTGGVLTYWKYENGLYDHNETSYQVGWTDQSNEEHSSFEAKGYEIDELVFHWCLACKHDETLCLSRDILITEIVILFVVSIVVLVFCIHYYHRKIVRAKINYDKKMQELELNARHYRNLTTR